MKKKPDIIVWDENRGWYANKLEYGSNVGAPAIKPNTQQITLWKQAGINKVNHYFTSQFDELKKKYDQLIEEFKWNELIYRAKYNFEPVLGKSYFLYLDEDGNPYLSMISPTEWKRPQHFIGEFVLNSENRWEKIIP